MTRLSRFTRTIVQIRHQSVAKVFLRLGSCTQQRTASWIRSAQSLQVYNSLSIIVCRPRHVRESSNARGEFKRLAQFRTRPFSHFGNPDAPSEQSKQGLNVLKTADAHSTPSLSTTGSFITAIVVIVISGAVFYSTVPNPRRLPSEQSAETKKTEFQSLIKSDNMTGEELPGRPGTLTPREEEKLKELWAATLQVFGVLDNKELNGNGHAEPLAEKSDTKTSEKKSKKKRISLFRSKNKEDDAASTTSTESGAQTPTGEDDKYGQTKEFHEALANLSPDILRATFWSMVKHDHPDGLLLRFLRARKWDVEKALVMMVSTMRWRASEMHVDDDIMWNGEMGALEDSRGSDASKKKHGEDFLTQMRLGKSFLHGTDKEGRPMCFVRVRLHKQGEQSEESLERYTVFVIESARMILSPPVDTACVVFDMTGFSLANMDYAPVKFMIKCFEANYPESLGVVLVHKAPWIFQGIWKIIKGWLDPVVASKVHFTNDHEMEDFVPKSQIIKELHGAENWEYKYIEPVPGENEKMNDLETRDKLLVERKGIVDEYEKATVEWIKGSAASLKEKRHELAIQLRDDYWRLDPYIRARSYYDRVGLIQPGGKLQFYADKTTTATPTPTPTPTEKTETPAESAHTTNGGLTTHKHSANDVD